MLEVRLLGRFEIRHGQKTVEITSRPAQALIAFLVLNAGTAYRREKLAGQLWPDSTEDRARDSLRHALWRIRKALELASAIGYLKSDDLTISFDNTKEYWLDAAALPTLGDAASADEIAIAVDCYAGELLPGFYDEWVVLEREHLLAIYERYAARLLDLLQEQSRWGDILKYAEKWIALGQRPEVAFRHLMSAYAAQGDMAKATIAYDRCVKSLAELGVEPSEPTRRVYDDIKARRVPGQISPRQEPPARKPRPASNLPTPLTSFIGREKELKHIAGLLETSRLVTLTGPGGVGKTRLAIQVAGESLRRFKDGVFWVDLSNLSDAGLVPHDIAQSLRLSEIPGEPLVETLKAHLRGIEVLMVLDNCEHLVEAAAKTVAQLLAACPKLKIVVTSREALGILNERVWQVPSLPLPEARLELSPKKLSEFSGVRLFLERAQSARPEFELAQGNASAILEICSRLDGMPLAIELAAARLKILSVEEIATRLADVFSMLTAGSRTALARHQTLRMTIDWSHDLLSEPERILFRRLSVFAGGFTLSAAEAVCGLAPLQRSDILDLLGRLADKSLVVVDPAPAVRETRYRLLETIRQYTLEKLADSGEAPSLRDRHMDFFVQLAEKAQPHILGRDVVLWSRRLDAELDNYRAAMEWSTSSGKAVAALHLVGTLVYLFVLDGYLVSVWVRRIEQALASPEGMQHTLARAEALNAVGFLRWADIHLLRRGSELKEALDIGRELGDSRTIADAFRNLGLDAMMRGDYAGARAFLEQSLQILRGVNPESRNLIGTSLTLTYLADVALHFGEHSRALSLLEESVGILRGQGEKNFLAYGLRRLSLLALRQADLDDATALCQESLVLNREIGDKRGVIACLAQLGSVATAQASYGRAVRLKGAAAAQLEAAGIQLLHVDKLEFEASLELLRGAMAEKPLARSWARGAAMSMEGAVEYALQESRE